MTKIRVAGHKTLQNIISKQQFDLLHYKAEKQNSWYTNAPTLEYRDVLFIELNLICSRIIILTILVMGQFFPQLPTYEGKQKMYVQLSTLIWIIWINMN